MICVKTAMRQKEIQMNHKYKRSRNRRAGCKLCKPHKASKKAYKKLNRTRSQAKNITMYDPFLDRSIKKIQDKYIAGYEQGRFDESVEK